MSLSVGAIQDKSAEGKTDWVFGGIKSYFTRPTELVNLLEPLILALHWPGTYRQIVEVLPHFSEDLSLTDFLNVMVSINYNNESRHISLADIDPKIIPCLFIPYDEPALLILEKNDFGLLVIDGQTGAKKQLVDLNYSGVVYHFSLINVDKTIVSKQTESFYEMFHRFRPLIAQIFVLTLFYNLFIAVVPLYIMMIYDRIIPTESYQMAFSFLIGILIFLYGAQLLSIARIKIVAYIGARLDKTIGESIVKHILYLAPTYTENNTAGVQISRIKSFDNIRDFFTSNIAIMTCELPFALVFLALIFWVGEWLGFVPLILAGVFYLIYRVANPIVDRYIKAQSALGTAKQTFLLETFSRMRDIKQTGRSTLWEEKFDDMLINLAKSGFDNAYYNANLSTISELFMMLAALAMLVFGTLMSIGGNITLGALIAVMMLTWKVLNPLKSFFSSLPKVDQIATSIKQVNKLFLLPTEQLAEKKVFIKEGATAKIEFNRVTFRYRPELNPAILGVSFVVQPGDLICITGKNSAGKSTMLRLILGLYKPQAGNILINNMNIQQFDPTELRHAIAYMPQTNQLFYGTIKQNILLGDIVATEEDVITAAKLAGVHDEIMRLPEQYETRLGDQKSGEFTNTFLQLIVLSRTYIKKAPIMLFDEPGTGFDEVADKKFMEYINFKRKTATILWVTHRPSHLKIADKILYLENGEVALFGDATKVLERLPRSLI